MSILLMAAAMLAMDAETRQFREKDAVVANPAKAYLVIRTDYRNGIQLFRTVNDGERSKWEDNRRVVYEKARKKYEKALKNYESDARDWESGSPADRRMIGKKPVRPKEVTLETVEVAPIELANFVNLAGGLVIAKDASDVRTLLVELPAGEYRIHGVPPTLGTIGTGNCLCFGSVGFKLAAGQVYDGGALMARTGDFYSQPTYTPPSATPAPIAKLPGVTVVPVNAYAVGKFANWHATPVTRLQSVPGILGYNRDIPLDLARGNAPLAAIR